MPRAFRSPLRRPCWLHRLHTVVPPRRKSLGPERHRRVGGYRAATPFSRVTCHGFDVHSLRMKRFGRRSVDAPGDADSHSSRSAAQCRDCCGPHPPVCRHLRQPQPVTPRAPWCAPAGVRSVNRPRSARGSVRKKIGPNTTASWATTSTRVTSVVPDTTPTPRRRAGSSHADERLRWGKTRRRPAAPRREGPFAGLSPLPTVPISPDRLQGSRLFRTAAPACAGFPTPAGCPARSAHPAVRRPAPRPGGPPAAAPPPPSAR